MDCDDDAGFIDEGEEITEAEPDSTEVVIHTGKVAVLAKISREQYNTGSAANNDTQANYTNNRDYSIARWACAYRACVTSYASAQFRFQ